MTEIIARSEWGAASPTSRRTISLPSSGLWLHHTAGSEPDGAAGVRAIQRFHQGPQRGWSDIAYNFVVDRRGGIFEGRGAGVQGAHTQGYNTDHAICVVGHYDNDRPTQASLAGVAALVAHGHAQGWWPDHITGGHRDVGSTSCPGTHLYSQIPHINRLAAQLEDDMATPEEIWSHRIAKPGDLEGEWSAAAYLRNAWYWAAKGHEAAAKASELAAKAASAAASGDTVRAREIAVEAEEIARAVRAELAEALDDET